MAVFATVATWVATTFAISMTAATILTGLAVSVALYGVSALLTPRPKTSRLETPDYQAVVNQATGHRLRGYGRIKVGGTRAFFESQGGVLYQIVMMHTGEIDGFEQIFLGDKIVNPQPNLVVHDAPFSGYVSIYQAHGLPDQPADPLLSEWWPGTWTADHRLRGIAYLSLAFRAPSADEFPKVYAEGHNTAARAIIKASKVYNPRNGSTAWSDNPALCILDYLTHPDGYRLSPEDVDTASFAEMAWICDDMVPLKGGGNEPRYRLSGMYSLNDDPKSVLQRMLDTCDGELVQTPEGKVALRGGTWTEPTVTIGSSDILSYQIEQGSSRFAAFNRLKIIYTDPSQDFQGTEAAAWNDYADQSERGVIEDDFTVDMVQSPSQARRLAKIYQAKQNPRWKGSISATMAALDALGQRILRVQIDELEIDTTFFIASFSIRPDLSGVELGIVSLSSSAYAWNPEAEEEEGPPPPAETAPDLTLPVPAGLTLTLSGTRVIATVTPPARDDLMLEGQIRPVAGGVYTNMDPNGTWSLISTPQTAGVSYEVRTRYRTPTRAIGAWSPTSTIAIP